VRICGDRPAQLAAGQLVFAASFLALGGIQAMHPHTLKKKAGPVCHSNTAHKKSFQRRRKDLMLS
jgi:hypothetical protein